MWLGLLVRFVVVVVAVVAIVVVVIDGRGKVVVVVYIVKVDGLDVFKAVSTLFIRGLGIIYSCY